MKILYEIDYLERYQNIFPVMRSAIEKINNLDAIDENVFYNVTQLTLNRTSDESLEHLQCLKGLKHLDLNGCKTLSDNGLQRLGSLHRLTHLSITDGISITDESLRVCMQLHHLQALYLSRINVQGPGLRYLNSLGSLESLGLNYTNVDDNALRTLAGHSLKQLSASYTRVRGYDSDLWQSLTNLELLDLNGAQIDDQSLPSLLKPPNLYELNISDTNVTGRGFLNIDKGSSVRVLRLQRTKISDVEISYIAILKDLEILDVSGTAVTEKGVDQLSSLKKLRQVLWTRPSAGSGNK